MAIEDDFAESLRQYFGPWRGDGVKTEIAKWARERNVSPQWLMAIRKNLILSHKLEPVNTIGIVELESEWRKLEGDRRNKDQMRQIEQEEAEMREARRKLIESYDGPDVATDFFQRLRERLGPEAEVGNNEVDK